MSLRSRLLLAFTALVIVPLVVLGLGIRYNVSVRLAEQFEQRVAALASVIQSELAQEGEEIGTKLDALVGAIEADNPFRRAALQDVSTSRRYLLDYAGGAMRLAGLSMLQIQDPTGRIVSSGHFRNEFDRLEPQLPNALRFEPSRAAMVSARTATAPFLAFVRLDTVRLGDAWFTIVGGTSVERQFLSRLAGDQELAVSLVNAGSVLSSDSGLERSLADVSDALGGTQSRDYGAILTDQIVTEIEIPYLIPGGERLSSATILVTHPLRPLGELRRSIDLWLGGAVLVTAIAALLIATWLSNLLSRPLAELARKTSRVDLDRLDVGFDSDRKDEVGTLSRVLRSMTDRLHGSAAKLKEIERRAAVGEIARQVNHDIKNGLIPIRNVLRHMEQVSQDDPGQLLSVYCERQATLGSGIAYLEDLAANYARLYPRQDRQPCDINNIVQQVSQNARRSERTTVVCDLPDGLPLVTGDPVAVRRIVENLMRNAIEAVDEGQGAVTLSTRRSASSGSANVRITIADNGPGMTDSQLEKAFEDFYTTKATGTGLGLSVVRRLVLDLGGTLRVETEPGVGTTFIVELPGGGDD